MMELAYFYGWTIDYIRSLTIYEMDKAREFMNHVNNSKSQGGDNASQRHAPIAGSRNR